MNRNLRESLAGGRHIPAMSRHRRGQSLNGISRDSDENLDLFSKSRRSLPLSSSDESSDVSVKLERLSMGSIKLPKSGGDDLLSSTDGGKHDYDWLLTPPGTPLGSESHPPVAAPKATALARSVSTAKTSRLSVSQSESSRHSSRPTRSSSVTRPSVSSTQYSTYSSNRSPSSILNTSSASISSSVRPSSPSTRSSSSARPSTPSRTTTSRSSTPSRIRSGSTTSTLDRTKPTQNSRSSTPTSKPQISASFSTTGSRSNSRPSTPTRRSPVSSVSATSGSTISSVRFVSNAHPIAPLSRPSSPGPRVRQPQQPIVPPDFPLETPPNLRTTLPDRPVSAGRSRPGATAAMKGSPDPKSAVNAPRRNSSPITTRGRLTETPGRGRVSANGHLADAHESHKVSNVLDLTSRRTLRSATGVSESTGLGRSISKSSLDMAIRHMDIRSGKGSTRLLSSTTLFPQSIRSAASKIQAIHALSGSGSINSNGSLQSGDMSENGSTISANGKYMENGDDAIDGRRFLAKLSDVDIYESTRYDALLLKEDVKNTNWLHSIDDKSDQGLIFENGFEPLPEPFGPL